MPRIAPLIGNATKAAIPYNKKNKTVHQPAIEFGVFISFLLEKEAGRIANLNKTTLIEIKGYEGKMVQSPACPP